ncbi:MAG: 16S rRNA (guanine(527)-N(7))-methyltransferase RsmG [Gammaproteobacteria bacterium]|nr:16S rRNA (guanine(527)-N(7))-methyltransferase RsmG [Gammaproteobacteria bacterium]
MTDLNSRLQQGIEQLSLQIEPQTRQKLIQYIELIAKWNKSFNLTAIRDIDDMLTLHLLDSLAVLPYIDARRVLDVGAGAGLPGMVLALCCPQKEFVLLDTNGKKTRFMTQAKIELGLTNVEVVHARVDEYQPLEAFDAIISRAFASVSDMLDYVDHLVTDETTKVLAMKADGEQEISQLSAACKAKWQIEQIHQLVIPGLQAKRQLIAITKLATENSPGE